MAQPNQDPTGLAWVNQVPPVLWPVPVTETPQILGADFTLVGKRLVVSAAGANPGYWLYEQRAVTKIHDRNGQQVLGVVSESDWYRQQRDPTHPVVPHSVPVEQVFFEATVPMHDASPISPDQSDIRRDSRSASLVTDSTQPPVRWPRQATRERFVTGSRCWFLHREGPQRGYRAVGEPRRREVGTIDFSRGLEGLDTPIISTMIPLYRERDWYRWMDTGDRPEEPLVLAETKLVYLE